MVPQKRTAEGMATRAWKVAEARQKRRACHSILRALAAYAQRATHVRSVALRRGAVSFMRRAIGECVRHLCAFLSYVSFHKLHKSTGYP